jgi:hypothetical protein
MTDRKIPSSVLDGLVFVALAARQLLLVNRYAVNVLYWDQWDFYRPLFDNLGWWEMFVYQHGPHRMGVGSLVIWAGASVSGWNCRYDAFEVSLFTIAAAALALRLTRFYDGHRLPLVAIPLLFFNVHQWEMLVAASNPSHGAAPLFLLMLYCLAWFWRKTGRRILALSALTFLLIFTGFGLFVGVLTPLLLAVEGIQAWRAKETAHARLALLGVGACIAAWGSFAHGYRFEPAAPGFRFPYEKPLAYFTCVASMQANFYGRPGRGWTSLAAGFPLAGILVGLCGWHASRCIRLGVANEPRSVVIFCLTAFELMYCAATAIGRVPMGDDAGDASRYVPLLVPAGLAIYLQLAQMSWRSWAWRLALLYTLMLVPATALMHADEHTMVSYFSEGRQRWALAYLRYHDQAKADEAAHFKIYPTPILADRLRYLEEHHLNFFRDAELSRRARTLSAQPALLPCAVSCQTVAMTVLR